MRACSRSRFFSCCFASSSVRCASSSSPLGSPSSVSVSPLAFAGSPRALLSLIASRSSFAESALRIAS